MNPKCHHPALAARPTRMRLIVPFALAGGLAVIALAGCGTASTPASTSTTSAPPTTTVTPTPAASPSAPETAGAAKVVATNYFDLYSAGQFAVIYPMIDPADRSHIWESVWVRVHQKCVSSSTSNLTYSVSHPILAGNTVVMTVGLAGVGAALGSEQSSFVYSGGHWYYQPPDMAVYRHHGLTAAIAAAKAAGFCG